MKKSVKRVGCLLLGGLMAFGVSGCGNKKQSSSDPDKVQKYDTETRPIVFSTDALDGNFNPFFATSATDSTIAAMTQVGMLTTDEKGNVACGEDEPTVVLSYTQNEVQEGGKTYTDYEFVIKNGIKFSDGVALTIKDVLFNLYVYLDPMYMGSATIYSTDIVGLQAYRSQSEDNTQTDSEMKEMFYADADTRIDNVVEYLDTDSERVFTPNEETQIKKDIATLVGETTAKEILGEEEDNGVTDIGGVFGDDLKSDWNMYAGTQESYKEKYTFTEDWEIYLFNQMIVTRNTLVSGGYETDANGKYVTSLDDPNNGAKQTIEDAMADSALIAQYMEANSCTEEEAKYFISRDTAIEIVYDSYAVESYIPTILYGWTTGANVRDKFASEEMTKFFENKKDNNDGKLVVESISGIKTAKKEVNGVEHDVLKVRINGVDPKAIWNFGFSVAPMHYYSNAETIANTAFGVDFGNQQFFEKVLQDPDKNGLPVGAGTYKASNADGATTTRNNFYKNNWVYFERNEYFETLGEGINNANIKYLRYRVVGSDKIMNALETGAIDVGTPNATPENIASLGKLPQLNYKTTETNGYGYVGVNAKHVPVLEVRRAIMMAMNTATPVTSYYTEDLADVVYRSMSRTSWAYPENATEYAKHAYNTDKATIKAMVDSARQTGHTVELGGDNVYIVDGKRLEYIFTIAGETTDHPAYEMFMDAAAVLNDCGFDITVATDVQALAKLASGGLAVWAAAWSSTVDPDLYQVYHKDSKATSVKNWGYDAILNDTTYYSREASTITALSSVIEAARETLDEDVRKGLYATALDYIMELAVELPTYQRNDCVVYNNELIDAATLNQNPTAYRGVTDKLWEINYN